MAQCGPLAHSTWPEALVSDDVAKQPAAKVQVSLFYCLRAFRPERSAGFRAFLTATDHFSYNAKVIRSWNFFHLLFLRRPSPTPFSGNHPYSVLKTCPHQRNPFTLANLSIVPCEPNIPITSSVLFLSINLTQNICHHTSLSTSQNRRFIFSSTTFRFHTTGLKQL